MQRLLCHNYAPVICAFIASIILSLLAIWSDPVLNRDGMLYIEAAELWRSSGPQGALKTFDWIFLPAIIGAIANVTSLSTLHAGYFYAILFFGMTSSAVVLITQKLFPKSGWFAALTFFALTGLAGYREQIIREHGYWFSVCVSIYFAILWGKNKKVIYFSGSLAALILAALFRPEAIVFFLSIFVWIVWSKGGEKEEVQRPLLKYLIVLFFAVSAGYLTTLVLDISLSRILGQVATLNFFDQFNRFAISADKMAKIVLNEYSADMAYSIFFWGLLSVIFTKLATEIGILWLPFLMVIRKVSFWGLISQASLPLTYATTQFFVLTIFLFWQQFLTGRYVNTILLLLVPVFTLLVIRACSVSKASKRWIVGLLFLVSVTNVIFPTNQSRTEIIQAGNWIAANRLDPEKGCLNDTRVSFYSNFRNGNVIWNSCDLDISRDLEQFALREWVAIRIEKKYDDQLLWVSKHRNNVTAEFTGDRGDKVFILNLSKRGY